MGIGRHSLAVVAAVVLHSSVGLANRHFPASLAERLHMPCAPPCRVCHISDYGGPGNLRVIPKDGQLLPGFGKHIESACPVDGGDDNGLRDDNVWACVVDASAMSDLDGDGVFDLDELTKGQDPNAPGDAPVCGNSPEYGCAPARVAPSRPVDDVGAVAAAGVVLAGLSVLRRRR